GGGFFGSATAYFRRLAGADAGDAQEDRPAKPIRCSATDCESRPNCPNVGGRRSFRTLSQRPCAGFHALRWTWTSTRRRYRLLDRKGGCREGRCGTAQWWLQTHPSAGRTFRTTVATVYGCMVRSEE